MRGLDHLVRWRRVSSLTVVLVLVGVLGMGGVSASSLAAAAFARQDAPASAGQMRAHRNVAGEVRIPGDSPVGLPAAGMPYSGGQSGTVGHGLRSLMVRRAAASPAEQHQQLTVTVVLRRTRQAAFDRYLQQVYDRHSPIYHDYLTQAHLAERFGPSLSEYDQVKAWLASRGLRVTQVSPNRLSIGVRGTRAQAESAFQVAIADFVARTGKSFYANEQAPAVPASLASDIQSVSGLDDLAQPASAPAADAIRAAFLAVCGELGVITAAADNYPDETPDVDVDCDREFDFTTGAGSTAAGMCKPYPSQKCVLYDQPLADLPGAGQKIGLLEFDTFHPSDVSDYLGLINVNPAVAGQLSEVNVNGGVATPGAGESEVLLDADIALTGAPGAKTVVYDAPSSTGFVQMFQAMVADGDTVISNSWSQCEDQTPIADAQAIDSVLASAAASGVTVLNGTGDSGSNCLDGSANTVGVPADSPNATAVGGTSLTLGPAGTYGSETWWNGADSAPQTGSGGFGVSKDFPRPAYQNGLTSATGRSVPDVAVNADPASGYGICQADAGGCPDGLDWGGTSAATPVMAAYMANLNELQGSNLGALNPQIYPLANSIGFHDAASMGSDFAHVGLGSPNVAQLSLALRHAKPGSVSAANSSVIDAGDPPADGHSVDHVVVFLRDASGNPVPGKTVTLVANPGSSASITSASAVTTAGNGAASFEVSDSTPEQVTLVAADIDDNVKLAPIAIDFTPPVATGAQISAGPATVAADGTSQATIEVYLENALGQPAAGKTVTLSQTGSATITPAGSSTPGDTAVTGSDGYATFTATDMTAESDQFSAVDTTDGNLPVPGSGSVLFSSGSPPSCANSPVPAAGYGVTTFAQPFANDPYEQFLPGNVTLGSCEGADAPVFDSSGNAYVDDGYSGTINVLPPAGGTASTANQLPDANFGIDNIHGLVFGKDGELYASLYYPPGNGFSLTSPEVVQLDPSTGAIVRVVATGAQGLPDCPWGLAVDPLTGDLFISGSCTGYAYSGEIARISNPSSSTPTVSSYASVNGIGNGLGYQLSFAPDGTLYAVVGGTEIVKIAGTNTSQPGTVTQLVKFTSNYGLGVAVTASNSSGAATQLEASDLSGYVYSIDLTQNPPAVSTVASPAASGGILGNVTFGPDSCLYLDAVTAVDRFGQGSCGSGGNVASEPSISLTQSSGTATPTTGSSVGFTATLSNVSSPSGTPVHFTIAGPNLSARLVDADSSGGAAMSYQGIFGGVDTIIASVVVNGQVISSAPVQIHWTAGLVTTFLDLSATQQGGPVGQPATVTASLWDATQGPMASISGQTVTLALGAQSCQAQTNAAGVASCQLTPGSVGLLSLTASYAGDKQYTASRASNEFDAAAAAAAPPPGVPGDTQPPVISGTPAIGQTLSCSTGTWTNEPTAYSYQWQRDGMAIASGSSYTVQASDQGDVLTCMVTASNSSGTGTPAISAAVHVPAATTTSTTTTMTAVTTPGATTPAATLSTPRSNSAPMPVPPLNTVAPRLTGLAKAGKTLSCSAGSWSGGPTRYAYQWSRNGTPLIGASGATYKIGRLDEGSEMTCTVTASNAVGAGQPVSTEPVTVAVPKVKGCPKAVGALRGNRLGAVRLGMTRAQARRMYRHSSNRGRSYEDFFCLTPIGVRVGYASPVLLDALSKHQRPHFADRVVWISTSDPIYAIAGIRVGATVAAVESRFRHGHLYRVGRNDWYLASAGPATAILKIRGGEVQEVGIANKQLTQNRKASRAFLRSFS